MRRRHFFLGLTGLAGCTGSGKPRLNVINYSDYIARETLTGFEREFGVELRYSAVIEGSEETIARTMSGNSGWDVVFPENRLVQPMREMGLLGRLEPARLPNLSHLAGLFRKPAWDPAIEWSAPYLWSCCGILAGEPAGELSRWQDLWQPRYRGKITMLDEPSEVFAACLKILGYSINTDSPEQLRRAQELALEQKQVLRAYLNTEVRDQVVAGDVWAAQLWQGSAQLSIDQAPELRFVHPAEGYSLYCDCVGVLAESRRRELAHEFINYLYRPEVARANSAASRALSPCATGNETVLERGEWFQTASGSTQRLRDRLWTEIKSA
ncbi:MAG: spermidine/putrescine ABC transporter substrate-binding protein [Bryobacter sp.]|nr:spermidine/putrescine ABC transporter substrate-binding protein [Bryobacter sp. CoA8 C33]